MECFRPPWGHQLFEWHKRFKEKGSLWGRMRGVGGVRQSSWLAKGLELGLLCWGFKGVQEEIPKEEASTLQIWSVVFLPGQCTSPQPHTCHRLFHQDEYQDSSSASLSSRPCSLWLLVIPYAQGLSLWDNWECPYEKYLETYLMILVIVPLRMCMCTAWAWFFLCVWV